MLSNINNVSGVQTFSCLEINRHFIGELEQVWNFGPALKAIDCLTQFTLKEARTYHVTSPICSLCDIFLPCNQRALNLAVLPVMGSFSLGGWHPSLILGKTAMQVKQSQNILCNEPHL